MAQRMLAPKGHLPRCSQGKTLRWVVSYFATYRKVMEPTQTIPDIRIPDMRGKSATGNPNLGQLDRTPNRGVNLNVPNGLFNDVDPQHLYTKENLDHRFIVELRIARKNVKEIVAITEKCELTVRNVLKQPWARERILAAWKEASDKDLEAVFAEKAYAAVERIEYLAEHAESEQVKSQNNQYLVNRYLGTPTSKMEVTTKKQPEKLTDDEIRKELLSRRNAS